MPEFTFNYTTTGTVTVGSDTQENAAKIADYVMRPHSHPFLAVQNITTSDVQLTPQSTSQTRMDAAGMMFRYRHLLAQTSAIGPDRRALQDIVAAFIPGNNPQHAITLARGVIYEVLNELSTADIPDALRARADREAAIYQEFLDFTQPQEHGV